MAVLLEERGKVLGRAGGRIEEVLVGEVGEFLPAEDRQQLVMQALDDRRRRAGRNHRAPEDRAAGKCAENGLLEG